MLNFEPEFSFCLDDPPGASCPRFECEELVLAIETSLADFDLDHQDLLWEGWGRVDMTVKKGGKERL